MTTILITSGPTRQYLDPVRYLTNASSGRMGSALASAALKLGHRVILVSGPVTIPYPAEAECVPVVSTEEMLEVCQRLFPACDGVIGAAAPCDYRPHRVADQKISKTGEALQLELIETPDVVATLGAQKRADQWVVGFALETEDQRFRALTKLIKKSCDLMVSNGPAAIDATDNIVDVIAPDGSAIATFRGSKQEVADQLLELIQARLVKP